MNDICMNCGREHPSKMWGAECSCSAPNMVHQQPCTGCGRIIGQITDDDYCGPEKLYCPDCMDKTRAIQTGVNLCIICGFKIDNLQKTYRYLMDNTIYTVHLECFTARFPCHLNNAGDCGDMR